MSNLTDGRARNGVSAGRNGAEPTFGFHASVNEEDDSCNCFSMYVGKPDQCVKTIWAEQCCDGTDPDYCAKGASVEDTR